MLFKTLFVVYFNFDMLHVKCSLDRKAVEKSSSECVCVVLLQRFHRQHMWTKCGDER